MGEKRYLSFDIECANSKDGICKMCSLGYVVFDEKFNIIEKKDIIINPESIFDGYLFKKNSKVKLAYPKEYFRMFESFDKQYTEIKKS